MHVCCVCVCVVCVHYIQINIPSELVQCILDCVSQGEISRGLFHEAALNIFSVLIIYWKK